MKTVFFGFMALMLATPVLVMLLAIRLAYSY